MEHPCCKNDIDGASMSFPAAPGTRTQVLVVPK